MWEGVGEARQIARRARGRGGSRRGEEEEGREG